MRRLKIVGLVCMALCALGVMTATAAFGASTVLPEYTVETGAVGTSGKGTLLLESTTISCEKGASTISPTSKKLGTFRITFKECKAGGSECISLGQLAGTETIETTGEYHIVSLLSDRTHYEVWFLLAASDNTAALHLECASAAVGLVLVWGNFLGLIEVISEKTEKLIVEREGGGNTVKQKITKFGNNGGTETEATGIKGKLSTGTERKGGEESLENLLAMNTATSIRES